MNHLVKNFVIALRNLPRRGQHNVVKIVCLALGLGLSAVDIAEVYYEQTYDRCYPDHERICMVTESFKTTSDEDIESNRTSGGVAPLMKKNIAKVELATRVNFIASGEVELVDKRRINADIYLADSCFFDMFPVKILEGDARKGLTDPFCCVVSRTTAERMGGNVVGKKIFSKSMPGLNLTIAAVYEDYPHNSSFHAFDVIGSLNTQKSFSYDGQYNLVGNDRYMSYVRIGKQTSPDELSNSIRKMITDNYPVKELKTAGVEVNYRLTPIAEKFADRPDVKKMFWILSLLAFVLLATSLLNYVLIVVGNLISRSREMAVRKSFGADRSNLYTIAFSEAFVHLLLAVALGTALIMACRGPIEQILSAPLSVLIFNRGSWILAVMALVVLVVGGIVPGFLYNRLPVSSVFRGYHTARHRWKVWLLGFEFAMVSFLLGLLAVVSLQYRHIVGFDLGYRCNDIAVVDVTALSANDRLVAAEEVKKLPGVRQVSACNTLPFHGASGNNVYLPNEKEELFNIADLYTVGDNYFDMMHIRILEGRKFTHAGDSLPEVMVSRAFGQAMKKARGWDDVVGKKVNITEHSGPENNLPFTIIGMYEDIHIGNARSNEERRPSVMFYGSYTSPFQTHLLIRLSEASEEQLGMVQQHLQRFFPSLTIIAESMENLKNMEYTPQKNFRNGVMTAGLTVLIIALIGLIGYVNDEVNHRHKEIAIRKVNGAGSRDIFTIFLKAIMTTALPASIVGSVAAWLVARQWLMLFDNRIDIPPLLFVLVVMAVLLIVTAVTLFNCRRAADSNPVEFLKQE